MKLTCEYCDSFIEVDRNVSTCPCCGAPLGAAVRKAYEEEESRRKAREETFRKANEDANLTRMQYVGNNVPGSSRSVGNAANRGVPVQSGKAKSKGIALLLCLCLGWLGIHKFYEGKILLGIVYLLTCGFFGFGVVIDFIVLLFKSDPYYVK